MYKIQLLAGGGGGQQLSFVFIRFSYWPHIFGPFCSIQCNSQLDNEIEPSTYLQSDFSCLKNG